MKEHLTKAVARQGVAKSKWLLALEFDYRFMLLMILVLLSAFAVVYTKDLNRRLFMRYQQLQTQHNQLYINWGKLLLEESAWSTQARVQHIAQNKLHMVWPTPNQVVLVKVSN